MVIDTDGSAFITKAEFDSLKNNFQAQIDNYNSSIDSKIDGAIAAYLAGVQVSQTEYRKTYFYAPTMTCLKEDAKTWEIGRPSWSIKVCGWSGGATSNWPSQDTIYANYLYWAPTTNPSTYRETIINNINNQCAAFRGIVKTYQTWNWQFIEADPNVRASDIGGGVYGPKSNGYGSYHDGTNTVQDTVEDGKLSVTTGAWTVYDSSMGTSTWTPNSISASRNIDSTLYADIIVWSQDDTTHGFNSEIIETMNYTASAPGVGTTKRSANDTFDASNSKCKFMDFRHWTTHSQSAGPDYGDVSLFSGGDGSYGTTEYYIYSWPYIGVHSSIKTWHQLYNPNIAISGAEITDISKTNDFCLGKGLSNPSLKSGLPLCYCKDGDIITIPFDFEDHTKDYEVWVKMDAFKYNEQPGSGSDCLVPIEPYTEGSRNNSIKVTNGEGTYKFLVRRDSLIYIQWAQGTSKGGGTLKQINECSVQVAS